MNKRKRNSSSASGCSVAVDISRGGIGGGFPENTVCVKTLGQRAGSHESWGRALQAEVWLVPSPELSMCVSGTLRGRLVGLRGVKSGRGRSRSSVCHGWYRIYAETPRQRGCQHCHSYRWRGRGEWWVGDRWVSKGWMVGQ